MTASDHIPGPADVGSATRAGRRSGARTGGGSGGRGQDRTGGDAEAGGWSSRDPTFDPNRLGTEPRTDASLEAACTRLSRMAARLLDAPGALITLVEGDRPYLAGSVGLEEATAEWTSSPLAVSLAGHSGESGEALSIPDVSDHDLLASDPLHRELGFRAYLAVPIRPGEEVLGTVCALDRKPRDWTPDDVATLAAIAESVLTEVRLRGSFRQMRAAEAASSRAIRHGVATLVDDLDAVVNERDVTTGAFTFVSGRAEDLLGYPVERWLEEEGFWIDVVVHPADRERYLAEIEDPSIGGQGHDLHYRARTASGDTIWLRDIIRVVTDDDGRARHLRGVMVDVTDQRKVEQSLRLLQELAIVANEARVLADPLELALRRICAETGWSLGQVLRIVDGRLEPTDLRHAVEGTTAEPLVRASTSLSFEPGVGLPGRVLKTGRPAWITDVRADEEFLRREAAAAAGLASAFAFPVMAGTEMVAVCEFFGEEPLEPDERLMELGGHLGTVLGRIAERERAEEELRRAELLARRTVETAHEAFISLNQAGRVREWNAEAERTFGWSREEALGRPLTELIIPARHREAHEAGLERYLRTGEAAVLGKLFEIDGVRKDGTEIPVELSITPLDLGDTLIFNSFLRDITDRRQQENERVRRERQLAQAQKLARLGSWEWDLQNDEIVWSEELHRIFGTDPESFDPSFEAYLGRIHPDDRDLVESVVGAAAETHEDFMFEHRVVRDDGREIQVLSQGRMITDHNGRALRMSGTAQDITDRKELEEKERALATEQAARAEAEAAEGRISDILESITDAFFALDREWRFTYVNSEAEALLQRDTDDLVGRALWDEFPEAVGSKFEEKYREARETGRRVEFEAHYGPLSRWFEVRAYPSEQGLSVYFHDITDRREAEKRLRASEARYRFLADSIPQQVWTARPDGRLEYVNEVTSRFFDRPAEELVEDGWIDVLHPDDRDPTIERWNRSLESGEPYETEFRLARGDGEYRWHLARAQPQRTGEGEILRWFGTNTEVHEQKELERLRDQAMDELERVTHVLSSERGHLEEQAREMRKYARALKGSNEELDQFAYVASHDLKAPLRGIANLTEWLLDDLSGSLTEDTREYGKLLQNRVHRMESLIDGILAYSRAGRKHHEPEAVDTRELVAEVLDMLDPPTDFDVQVDGWMPTFMTERAPLQQVLLNLVGNALKHADGEDPKIRIALTDEGEEFYEISVSDNGPGIDPEYHDRIWTIFQTLKPRDEVEGTGIGLSVVKRTVEGQGGQVWVESEPGKGATFRFLWPRTPPDRSDAIE